ncbi:uncharacterized protein LOC112568169 [Pomacea canaliculata]|uniref:uncharacterized protein LOC112568169 n=1 Tax=Pomacea canaliculata TaxID=400727 RepID=UPI000D73B786|nr:uncharacterized protein LOC112568169 [Pomacea canaliculata]
MQGVVITCLVILYSVCGAEGIKLRNCNKTDGSTDLHEPIICEGISSNGSVVWYHQYKGVLAQCSVDGNCSTSYSDDYNITREANSTVSQLRILKGGTEDHGVVISCDDRVSSTNTNCTLILKKVEISNCTSSKVVVFEDAPEAITCQNIPRNSGNVWLRSKDGGTEEVLGNCSSEGICFSKNSNRFKITRDNQSTDSQLLILKRFREVAGDQITCEDTLQKTRHTCRLLIRHHPVLSHCNINSTCVNRNVSGSCFINNMFSSDNLHECVWTLKNMNNNSRVNRKAGDFGYSWDNDNTACNDKCYRGKCSLEWQLPQEKGNYIITVTVIGSTKTAFSQVISNDDTCKTFSTVPLTSVSHGATTPSKESLPSEAKNHPVIIIVIVLVAITALIIASVIFFVIFRRRRQQNLRRKDKHHQENRKNLRTTLTRSINVQIFLHHSPEQTRDQEK